MSLVELGGIAAVGFGVGLAPGIYHLLTFRKEERQWGSPEAVEFLGEHISKAKRSVDIASSELDPFVFNSLTPLISHQLTMNPKLRLRIITSSNIAGLKAEPSDSSENGLYNLVMAGSFGEQLKMKVAKTPPERNFGLIDSSHLYLEELHDPNSFSYKVTTYKSSGIKASEYLSKFEEMWESIEVIPLEQAVITPHGLELENPEEARRIVEKIEALPILQAV